jgi:hypothetical protein
VGFAKTSLFLTILKASPLTRTSPPVVVPFMNDAG